MSCFFWHKWSPWTAEQVETWVRLNRKNLCAPRHEYKRRCQRRHCVKCGKIEVRYINED